MTDSPLRQRLDALHPEAASRLTWEEMIEAIYIATRPKPPPPGPSLAEMISRRLSDIEEGLAHCMDRLDSLAARQATLESRAGLTDSSGAAPAATNSLEMSKDTTETS